MSEKSCPVVPVPVASRLNPALPALGVASLLAAGTNAYGNIVYSGPVGTLVSNNTVQFDIAGGLPYEFSLVSGGPGEGGYIAFGATVPGNTLVNGASASKLSLNDSIGPLSSSWNNQALVWMTNVATNWGSGTENSPIIGYVGFRFQPGSSLFYGWAQLLVDAHAGNSRPTVTLIDWAYQPSAGAILAGDTGAIPEPSTAALVIGATSLLAYRQRRRKAA